MINVFKHGLNKIKSKTNRTWEQQKYRNDLTKALKESRKMGEAGIIHAKQKLKEEKAKDEYVLAKYGTDKKGALAIIKSGEYTIFFTHIDEFTGLDEEVAIEIFEKKISFKKILGDSK